MDLVRTLLGFGHDGPSPTKTDDDDEVFPIYNLDDSGILREIMLKDGRIELHVPKHFTPERPAVRFSHEAFDVSINEHPLGSKMPKTTDKSSIQAGAQDFISFATQPGTRPPLTAYDLIKSGDPQIQLRITTFTDATIIALVWPHTLCDALGLQALLESWSLMLAGRDSEVPQILGAKEDLVAAAARPTEHDEQPVILEKRLTGLTLFAFKLRFLWNALWAKPSEGRSVFLSKAALEKIKTQAREEFQSLDVAKQPGAFISDGDIIVGWGTRILASSDSQRRPVTVACPVNLRYWLKEFMQPHGVYAQNLAIPIFVFLRPDAARGPIGHIAAANRQHLTEQTRPAQLKGVLRRIIQGMAKGAIVFGESNSLIVSFTNWTKAKILTAADFSPAVVRRGEDAESRQNPPGTMKQFISTSMRRTFLTMNIVRIVGKDPNGNYWLSGTLPPRTWAKMEEELKRLDA